MNLTGKCLKDFENYYKDRFGYFPSSEIAVLMGTFYDMSLSFKYGVYVDFFDENNIIIGIETHNSEDLFTVIVNDNYIFQPEFNIIQGYKIRKEARESAIKKANILYNENK